MLQITVFVIWHEFDVWRTEFVNFLKFSSTSLPIKVCRVKAALCFFWTTFLVTAVYSLLHLLVLTGHVCSYRLIWFTNSFSKSIWIPSRKQHTTRCLLVELRESCDVELLHFIFWQHNDGRKETSTKNEQWVVTPGHKPNNEQLQFICFNILSCFVLIYCFVHVTQWSFYLLKMVKT